MATSRPPHHPELPTHLLFGTATAAYQVEGAAQEDGRGPSIWDIYCRTPGRVARGETGDVACDHYHRHAEDVALLADLGVDLYRFSVSWPRIQPTGRGRPNPEGLAFYDRLVDGLLAAGIDPVLTLYHWDLPQALEDEGGWRVRDTAHRFGEYTAIVAERLGDRVDRWITLNEPFCSAFVGHAVGRHAPGTREGRGALAAAHHLLLAHGTAVGALRAADVGEVGITLNPDHLVPATGSEADHAAVERARTLHNRTWFDPLFTGAYPDNEKEVWGELADASFRVEGDLDTIGRPLDFLGVNFYRPIKLRDAPHTEPDPARRTAVDIGVEQVPYEEVRHTTMGWPVVPESFTELLVDLDRRYPGLPPILITENGSAEPDVPDADGRVHDTDRVDYLRDHLAALGRAIKAGVDVRGYFVWSLLDNFEWAFGYDRRFGLVRVDYDRLDRHPKDSFHWYRDYLTQHRSRRSREAGA
ncbi:GH1 family beta-glucosidase [Nocardiopsis sp. MG754419]|uniref:GH1 family beta-glucosidase n=1 Tax=Nocardiopsis sp. MG754419 TaxID=2259865 RepID=UPI001BAD1878|nr:GH1 family beta-glucosidase [Nocardiopsis sp. MG754419]MBR8740836.1 beta-glucosidase [Nocardiopsis sp. MG754419]